MREEDKLIRQLNAGSYDSFTQLYDQWVARLYQFVLKTVKSESVAREIVQDTFVRVWESHASINPEKSFKSYLFTIAFHLMADHFRQQLRHPLMPDYFNYASSFATRNEAEQTLSLEDFLKHLETAKQKLTPRQRMAFELSKEQNFSHAEIEQQMGVTNQTVRNLLSAAMQTIRREMEPYAPLLLLFLEL